MKNLNLFGPVYPYSDCVNAIDVGKFLNDLQDGEEFTVYMNSPGGSVFEGLTIYNLLKEYQDRMTIKIVGEASSIASVIVCAAAKGKTLIAETALMLIHNPWTFAIASEDYMKKLNKTLATIKQSIMTVYQSKSTKTTDELNQIMTEADYHNAESCVELGIADEVYIPSPEEAKLTSNSETVKNELLKKHEFFNLKTTKESTMTIEEVKAEALKFQNEALEAKAALTAVQNSLIAKETDLKNAQEQINNLQADAEANKKTVAELKEKALIDEAKAFCEEMFQAGKLTRAEINGNAKVDAGELPAKVSKLIKMKNVSEELYLAEIEEIKARANQIDPLKAPINAPTNGEADDMVDYIVNDFNKRGK